jgi:hypothetical protein
VEAKMTQVYRDFSLMIDPQGTDSYRVRASSGGAEAANSIVLPIRAEDVGKTWAYVNAPESPARHCRPSPSGVAPSWKALGRDLFNAVFGGGIGELYASCWTAATDAEQGVRTRLHLRPREADQATLSRIPWELMYDGRRGVYMGLDPQSPLVRHLDLPRPAEQRNFEFPLRVLVAASSPHGAQALNLEGEQNLLRSALAGLERVQVEILDSASPERLREKLLSGSYQILHFMGHGLVDEEGGSLLFSRSDGSAVSVSGDSLAHILQGTAAPTLTLLNACSSAAVPYGRGSDPLEGVAAALVRGGQAAVVGMQFSITDRAALLFSAAFYERLSAGESVEAAVAEARLAISLNCPESSEWAAPVLFMRGIEPKEDRRARLGASPPPARNSIYHKVIARRIVGEGEVAIVGDSGPTSAPPADIRLQVDADVISGGTIQIGGRKTSHGTD